MKASCISASEITCQQKWNNYNKIYNLFQLTLHLAQDLFPQSVLCVGKNIKTCYRFHTFYYSLAPIFMIMMPKFKISDITLALKGCSRGKFRDLGTISSIEIHWLESMEMCFEGIVELKRLTVLYKDDRRLEANSLSLSRWSNERIISFLPTYTRLSFFDKSCSQQSEPVIIRYL